MPRQLYYFDIFFDAILPYFEQNIKYKYNSWVQYREYIAGKIGASRSYVYRWEQYKQAINDGTQLYNTRKDISLDFRNNICETYNLTSNIWDINNKDVEYIKYIKANMLEYYIPMQILFNSFKNIQKNIFGAYIDILNHDEINLLKKLDKNVDDCAFELIIKSTKNEFLFEASKIYRSKGKYKKALKLIEKLEKNKSDFYYRLVGEIKHEKAILYSAKDVEKYDEALEILQELVGFNYDSHDPEIDILIASNYKRKALLNEKGESRGKEVIKADKNALEYINKSIYFYDKAKDLIFRFKNCIGDKINIKKAQLQKKVDELGNVYTDIIDIENISVYGDKCIAEIFKKIECFSKLSCNDFILKINKYMNDKDTELQISTYFGREVYASVKEHLNLCQTNKKHEKIENIFKKIYDTFAHEYTEKRNYILKIGTLNKGQIESILENDPIYKDIKDKNIQDELKKYCVENFIYNPHLDLYYLEKQYNRLEIYYSPLNLCYMEKIKYYLYKEEESQPEDEKRLNKYIENIYQELKTNHHWSPNETNWWEFITDIEFKMLASKPLDDISGIIESNLDNITIDHLTATLRQLKNVYVETIGKGQDENAEKLIKILENVLDAKQNLA